MWHYRTSSCKSNDNLKQKTPITETIQTIANSEKKNRSEKNEKFRQQECFCYPSTEYMNEAASKISNFVSMIRRRMLKDIFDALLPICML